MSWITIVNDAVPWAWKSINIYENVDMDLYTSKWIAGLLVYI